MIDARVLRDEPERVKESQRKRGESASVVDEARTADERRRAAIVAFDELRAEQRTLGAQIPTAAGEQKQDLLVRTRELSGEVKVAQATQGAAQEAFDALVRTIPNLVHPEAPAGGEDDFVVLEHVGEPRDFTPDGFAPRDHVEIGRELRAIDLERGVKVSGARFYYLTGIGAQLELALVAMAMQTATDWGFTPMIPPSLVKPSAMEGTGFLGQAADDVYYLERDDLYLVGTSEVPLAAYHSDEILDRAGLPLRYVAVSPCFRREAGSYGKDTRGIIRVHWFDKVEMFTYTTLDRVEEEHQRLLGWEKEWLRRLELPFRVIDTAGGDLGLSASRKFDCEVWIPTQGRYRELTSTSNCTQYQARRLGIRTRGEHGTEPVATLNGTLCAMARTIVALLENHQQADGSIRVPEALRPFLGGLEHLKPPA